jgi:heme/copper-type cytochrome/quinol oxidase subunit 1
VTVIGLAMLVTGITMTVWRWTHATESFGWFAYAPLSDSTFAPGPGTAVVVSYVLTAVGGVVTGLGAGILRAARSGHDGMDGDR